MHNPGRSEDQSFVPLMRHSRRPDHTSGDPFCEAIADRNLVSKPRDEQDSQVEDTARPKSDLGQSVVPRDGQEGPTKGVPRGAARLSETSTFKAYPVRSLSTKQMTSVSSKINVSHPRNGSQDIDRSHIEPKSDVRPLSSNHFAYQRSSRTGPHLCTMHEFLQDPSYTPRSQRRASSHTKSTSTSQAALDRISNTPKTVITPPRRGSSLHRTPKSPATYTPPGQLAHKPDIHDLRRSSLAEQSHISSIPQEDSTHAEETSNETYRRRIERSSMDKPLPPLPPDTEETDTGSWDVDRNRSRIEGDLALQHGYLVHGSPTPIDLRDYLDTNNDQHTHVHTTYSPPVIKEVRETRRHHIQQQAVTREIHRHHMVRKVLPVVDAEVLPARHFIQQPDGELEEVGGEILEERGIVDLQRLIREAVRDLMLKQDVEKYDQHGQQKICSDIDEGKERQDYPQTEEWTYHPPIIQVAAEAQSTGADPVQTTSWASGDVQDAPSQPGSETSPVHAILPINLQYH